MGSSTNDIARRVIDHPAAHLRVLGPPGSGKTRLLVERFRALEARHGAGRVFILTYSVESHRRLTDLVSEKDAARVGPPRVFTYSRLAEEIIESSGARPPTVVAELEEHLLLQRVITDREGRLESELRSIGRSQRFQRDLLEVCHLLLQNNVAARTLQKLKAAARRNLELADVLVLYDGFRRALASKRAATYYDIAWRAVEHWRGGSCHHPVAEAAAVLVEDFQDVDAGQFELLTSIAPPGGSVSLNVFGDPMGSVFAHRGTQHGYLMLEFPRVYGGETFFLPARAPEGGVPEATLEALLEETIGGERREYLPVVLTRDGGLSGGLRVETVRDEVTEVYVVAARIAELLRREILQMEDIAIVTNDKQKYEPLLSAAATQRGIPLDTGRLKKRVFGDFVDAFLSLVDSPDDTIAARAILTSPLFRHLRETVPLEASGGSAVGQRVLEGLRSFVENLRRTLGSVDASRWMRILVERCLRRVCAACAKESGDESVYQDLSRLLESWDRYAAAVDAWGGRPSVGAFAGLDGVLAKRRSSRTAGAVPFLSCREAKGRFFSAVFVLGCSELLFPSAGRNENVFPLSALEEALRSVFSGRPAEVYRARSAGRQLTEEHHLLYIALTRSRGYLHVTAPETFSGEDYPAPSTVLARTIPGELLCAAQQGDETPPQVRFAESWIAGGSLAGADRRLDVLSPAGSHWHARKPVAEAVGVRPFPLSPSSLKTYVECGRHFFYRKVLRIPEAESPAAKVGSLLHAVMADLGRRFPSQAALISGATDDVVRELVDKTVQNDENVTRASFYDRSLRHHLEEMVTRILDLEREDPKGYTITATEKVLGFSFGPWDFAGRIDRVQETPAGHRVIVDFKTGKFDKTAKTLRKKTLAALEGRKEANWQVPLYAWGARTSEGSLPHAFTHIVASTSEAPLAVHLLFHRGADDVPPEAARDKRSSYLLETEVEDIMGKAAEFASEIFTPRTRFEKTEDTAECRHCDFRRLCGREEK